MTDTLGLVLSVRVQPGNVQDRDGADEVVARAKAKYPRLRKMYVDAGYQGRCAQRLQQTYGLDVEVVRRADDRKGPWQGPQLPLFAEVGGFRILPKRWVVERTHAWNGRPRRMAKDQDVLPEVSEAWIWFIQACLLLRRLARPQTCGGNL